MRERDERTSDGEEPISNDRLRKEKDREYRERKLGFNGKIDMSTIRATDIPTNKDLYMPGPAKLRKEIEIQTTRLDRLETVDKYIKEYCDSDGIMKGSQVLTDQEEKGRKEILEGVKTKDWLVYTSDKSGRIVLDTKENFIDGMREHFSNDPVVTEAEVRKGETVLNNHSRMWGRIFNIGSGTSGRRRCARGLIATFATIPVMQGLRKDHKSDRDRNPVL